MKYTLLLLLLCPLFVLSQEAKSKVSVNTVRNSVRMGPMTGNQNLTFGVKNIIQEVLQDKAQHKLVILQGVGHQGQYEAPDACFEAINAFIKLCQKK